jgi:hypothetical protein
MKDKKNKYMIDNKITTICYFSTFHKYPVLFLDVIFMFNPGTAQLKVGVHMYLKLL